MKIVVSGVPRGYQTPRPGGRWLQEGHRRRIEEVSKEIELVEMPQEEAHRIEGKVEGVEVLLAEGGNRVHARAAVGHGEHFVIPRDSHSFPLIGDRIIDIFCENPRRYIGGEHLLNVCDSNRGC